MNYLLHIDTSGDTCTIALAADGRSIAIRTSAETRNQSAFINTMIQEVLAEAGISIAQLSGIVICAGPGSYTGLRIGMGTAKGICYAADIPLLADNKLTLLANQAIQTHPGYTQYVAILPAREKEYFSAIYDRTLNALLEPQHLVSEELENILIKAENIIITGNTKPLKSDISLPNAAYIDDNDMLDIDEWAKYSFERYKCNGIVNLASVEPFYLKQVYTHNSNKIN